MHFQLFFYCFFGHDANSIMNRTEFWVNFNYLDLIRILSSGPIYGWFYNTCKIVMFIMIRRLSYSLSSFWTLSCWNRKWLTFATSIKLCQCAHPYSLTRLHTVADQQQIFILYPKIDNRQFQKWMEDKSI